MSNILIIDTATEACSIALKSNGQLFNFFEIAPRQHGELVLPNVDKLLKEANISLAEVDVIGFGRGPGAFTGLRICISIVQGLAYGANIPVVGVSSLQAMAQSCFERDKQHNILAAIDARMGEVYWGQYRENQGIMELVGAEQVISPESVVVKAQTLPDNNSRSVIYRAVGTGWQTYAQALSRAANVPTIIEHEMSYPNAIYMFPMVEKLFAEGKAVSAELAQPVYLRNDVAKKKEHQKKV